MRVSQLFGKTQREIPAEADTISHQLLLRAGMIQQVAAGIYSYLPLAWRSLKKIENIIRDEMNKAGGQEITMPVLQPQELWEQTGRAEAMGKILFTLFDRRERKLKADLVDDHRVQADHKQGRQGDRRKEITLAVEVIAREHDAEHD